MSQKEKQSFVASAVWSDRVHGHGAVGFFEGRKLLFPSPGLKELRHSGRIRTYGEHPDMLPGKHVPHHLLLRSSRLHTTSMAGRQIECLCTHFESVTCQE